jgi:hypothetical protein
MRLVRGQVSDEPPIGEGRGVAIDDQDASSAAGTADDLANASPPVGVAVNRRALRGRLMASPDGDRRAPSPRASGLARSMGRSR